MARRNRRSTPAKLKSPPREPLASQGGEREGRPSHEQSSAIVRLVSRVELLWAVGLVIAVLLAYQPAWQGGLLWDDNKHVTTPDLRSWGGLYRIWFDLGATQQYYPLLHSAFWVQHRLWGDATLGYHLVNILLHAAVAIMVALVLRRLEVPGAWLAAAIFALHPVHVESVAWITELKNILSAVFYLAAMLVYLRFDRTRKLAWYGGALGLFSLGLLSKTTAATLPAALLVIFWWQRGRLSWRRDVLPLVPFFALGVVAGAFTAWVERTLIGAEGAAFDMTIVERCLIAGRVVWFYLGKLLWPTHLIFVYPRWQVSQAVWWQYLFPAATLLLLAAAWALRRRWRGPLAALLFFVGTLFPALGFCNVYPFILSFVADHFQYLASLGVITLVSAGATLVLRRWQVGGPPAYCLCGMLLAVLAMLTWRQSRTYADIDTLYNITIGENADCWMAHSNLGTILTARGEFKEAVAHFRRALEIKPDCEDALNNLGNILADAGRFDEAIAYYRKALELKPNHPLYHTDLGATLVRRGQIEEAMTHYREALAAEPNFALAHNNLGAALAGRGEADEAIGHYRKALEINPDYAAAHNNLGLALADRGEFDEAIPHFEQAVKLRPDYVDAARNLQGIRSVREATARQLSERRELIRAHPTDTALLNNTAWTLATNPNASMRNGAEAVDLAQRAARLSNDGEPAILGTLAAAYAEARRFPEAVATARKALERATQQNKQRLAVALRARLALYEAGKTCREWSPRATRSP